MTSRAFSLADFTDAIREHMQANDSNVEETAIALLAENPNFDGLIVDAALNGGEIQDRIINVLLLSSQITDISIPSVLEVSSVEGLLRKAVAVMPNLGQICIGIALTEPEAERIFSILRMSPTLENLVFFLGSTGGGIAKPLEKYLRESPVSLQRIALLFIPYEDDSEPVAVADTAVACICNGIGTSTSLTDVCVAPPQSVVASISAANMLARAIANSKSLGLVVIDNEQPSLLSFSNQFCVGLMHTDPVQSLDLCLRRSENEQLQTSEFRLNRSAPWKPLLSQNVPLNYWPRILSKTNTWNSETSHGPLDALFFLMKEKNDVLLQNVRRRRIRKRQRASLYSPS